MATIWTYEGESFAGTPVRIMRSRARAKYGRKCAALDRCLAGWSEWTLGVSIGQIKSPSAELRANNFMPCCKLYSRFALLANPSGPQLLIPIAHRGRLEWRGESARRVGEGRMERKSSIPHSIPSRTTVQNVGKRKMQAKAYGACIKAILSRPVLNVLHCPGRWGKCRWGGTVFWLMQEQALASVGVGSPQLCSGESIIDAGKKVIDGHKGRRRGQLQRIFGWNGLSECF